MKSAGAPAPRSARARVDGAFLHHLPVQLTSFVGRKREVDDVRRLLVEARLLTLTGPGGIGKTRLALRVAEAAEETGLPVCFVDLAPLSSAEFVPATIAAALGAAHRAGNTLDETLIDSLRERPLLLVLDNVEHLLPATPLIQRLLAACPSLVVLATSRTVLGLYGEHVYPLAPLAVPASAQQGRGPLAIAPYEAVQLFVDRARASRPDFVLSSESAAAVAEICRRLDGLPLAIELAAARVRLLPPEAICAYLAETRLGFLTAGPRDVPARHQTLAATIRWSYDLLARDEQALFRRLGVFHGGWTLQAAAAITEAEDIVRGLGALVDHSLAQPSRSPPALREPSARRFPRGAAFATGRPAAEPRCSLLETVREFALERLDAAGETALVRRRHAAHFLHRAEQLQPALLGPRAGGRAPAPGAGAR